MRIARFRTVASGAAAVLVAGLVAAAAAAPSPTATPDPGAPAPKPAVVPGARVPVPQTVGETLADAIDIPFLPFLTTGSTCAYANDYDEACPYTGSTSPDVVYRYAPLYESVVVVSLCESFYDTKVYVYENDASHLVACNDDACGSDGYRSEIDYLPVVPGNDYYIVVDGYGGACGDYELVVNERVVEQVECPPDGVAEGEPPCGDDYIDQFNGGCSSTPPVFSSLPCAPGPDVPVAVCGVTGGFEVGGLDYRDTDWYVVDGTLNDAGFEWCVIGETSLLMGRLPFLPCDQISTFEDYLFLPPYWEGCLTVPPGPHYLWVSTREFGPSVGCHDYVMTLTGYDCGPISVEAATWGRVKGLYR